MAAGPAGGAGRGGGRAAMDERDSRRARLPSAVHARFDSGPQSGAIGRYGSRACTRRQTGSPWQRADIARRGPFRAGRGQPSPSVSKGKTRKVITSCDGMRILPR
eukprot:scaffold17146_cov110-Isochrysis_galbana.AAC.6